MGESAAARDGDAVGAVDGVSRITYGTDAVASTLPVACALALVFAALELAHPLVFGEQAGPLTTVVTAVGALLAGTVAVLAARSRVTEANAHPLLAMLALVAVSAAFVHLVEGGDPRDMVPLLLLETGVGAILVHRGWFLACTTAVWVAVAVAAGIVGGAREVWAFWLFYLGVATTLAVVIHLLRRRNLRIAADAVDRALRAATEDSATGLANRRGLTMLGRELVAVARRHNDSVHCSFVDVDGLKAINDLYGHDAGDDVIAAVAEALRRSSRDSDVVARWGGDEFVVVGLGSGVPPLDLEIRVQSFLRDDDGLTPHLAAISISVGRSMLEPWDTGDLQGLLWSADRDMYVRRALKGRSVPPVVTLDRTGDDEG
ncbi:MAG TPA: GGDEF domain-containing protein [Candidatus Nanopelagicales bacterium]|nr:GGDEF domain-containing protein [Candidatus Nanopelagicales bacterium]